MHPTFYLSGAAPSVCEGEKKCNRGIHCRQLVRRGPHLVFSFQYSRHAAVLSEQTKSRSTGTRSKHGRLSAFDSFRRVSIYTSSTFPSNDPAQTSEVCL